jgi:RHS repeat-associated protein
VSSAPSAVNIPTYDADGNMTFDGKEWFYVWNGENRLILASNAAHTVRYAYDHKGRMVWKTVSSSAAPPTKAIAYIWDDYNILRETISNHQSTITNSYVWGLDLSGTLQGAGGVGGLLAVYKDGSIFFPTYDANGNITEYISHDDSIAVHREYSAFGETIWTSGEPTDEFTFWWSTKAWCEITELLEYEVRIYCSWNGSWLCRDPIGEMGGENIYTFCGNRALGQIDYLGLSFSGYNWGVLDFVLWYYLGQGATIDLSHWISLHGFKDEISGSLNEIKDQIASRAPSVDCADAEGNVQQQFSGTITGTFAIRNLASDFMDAWNSVYKVLNQGQLIVSYSCESDVTCKCCKETGLFAATQADTGCSLNVTINDRFANPTDRNGEVNDRHATDGYKNCLKNCRDKYSFWSKARRSCVKECNERFPPSEWGGVPYNITATWTEKYDFVAPLDGCD